MPKKTQPLVAGVADFGFINSRRTEFWGIRLQESSTAFARQSHVFKDNLTLLWSLAYNTQRRIVFEGTVMAEKRRSVTEAELAVRLVSLEKN